MSNPIARKPCKKCGGPRDAVGRAWRCRPCTAAYQQAYARSHREKKNATQREAKARRIAAMSEEEREAYREKERQYRLAKEPNREQRKAAREERLAVCAYCGGPRQRIGKDAIFRCPPCTRERQNERGKDPAVRADKLRRSNEWKANNRERYLTYQQEYKRKKRANATHQQSTQDEENQ